MFDGERTFLSAAKERGAGRVRCAYRLGTHSAPYNLPQVVGWGPAPPLAGLGPKTPSAGIFESCVAPAAPLLYIPAQVVYYGDRL